MVVDAVRGYTTRGFMHSVLPQPGGALKRPSKVDIASDLLVGATVPDRCYVSVRGDPEYRGSLGTWQILSRNTCGEKGSWCGLSNSAACRSAFIGSRSRY